MSRITMTTRRAGRRGAAAALVAAMVLVGCSGGDDAASTTTSTLISTTTSTSTSTTTTTTVVETTVAPAEPVIRMPLTGAIVTDLAEIPQRPALAVKIDNHPRARPQSGLEVADIVFEENVESLTRFAAVFHSADVDPLGPIRSGRSQDIGILTGFSSPLFAWSGGNGGVRALIRESTLIDLDASFTPGYYRRSGRGGSPHNLYSSTDALWANTPEFWSVPPQVFDYLDPDESPIGPLASTIRVPMDGLRIRWSFETATGRYLRFHGDVPHETELGGQLSTDNVVVMAVEYRPSPNNPGSPEAQMVGEGPVVVFSAGTVREGRWTRDSIEDRYRFTLADGTPLGLLAGRTFVHLARISPEFVTFE